MKSMQVLQKNSELQENLMIHKKIPLVGFRGISQICSKLKFTVMQISIIEGDLTIIKEIIPQAGILPAEASMLAAYDVLSRIFGQTSVIRAYENTDPDTMDVR
jgi:hypothetical protein